MPLQPQNQITPELVGQRVTIQYELPNGYTTEVVGVITWYDEAAHTYMIDDRHGRTHRVPAKGIRFGRPVG